MVCFWKYTYFQNQKVKGEKLIPKQIPGKKRMSQNTFNTCITNANQYVRGGTFSRPKMGVDLLLWK